LGSHPGTQRPACLIQLDGTKTVNGVSCNATLFFCAAVDANGNAIVDQAPKQLVWDTNVSQALILSDGVNDYLYGPTGEPVEQIALASSTPTFMTYAAPDSSWLLTNAAGDETAFYQYDAFGTLSFGTPGSPFGYAGQYADTSSGLDNMRARWFEPQTGEFTTRDPAFAQTDQAYAYAADDPVNEADPSGDITCTGIFGWVPGCGVVTDVQNGISGSWKVFSHFFVSEASNISAVAGLAALVTPPPIDAVLGAVAVVSSAVATANDVVHGEYLKASLDSLSALLGGGGLASSIVAREADEAATAAWDAGEAVIDQAKTAENAKHIADLLNRSSAALSVLAAALPNGHGSDASIPCVK